MIFSGSDAKLVLEAREFAKSFSIFYREGDYLCVAPGKVGIQEVKPSEPRFARNGFGRVALIATVVKNAQAQ
jgi:hypothetical protein